MFYPSIFAFFNESHAALGSGSPAMWIIVWTPLHALSNVSILSKSPSITSPNGFNGSTFSGSWIEWTLIKKKKEKIQIILFNR
jgi:hypothetical protein